MNQGKYFNATYDEWMDRLENSLRKKYLKIEK